MVDGGQVLIKILLLLHKKPVSSCSFVEFYDLEQIHGPGEGARTLRRPENCALRRTIIRKGSPNRSR